MSNKQNVRTTLKSTAYLDTSAITAEGPHQLYYRVFSNSHVHVWGFNLDLEDALARPLEESLSSQEREFGSRFRFAKDRRRFVIRRGILRLILGQYFGMSPKHLRYAYNPYGKPYVPGQGGPEEIHFNLSHSEDLALIAVTRGRRVGVDVEQIKTSFDPLLVAEMCFSSRELSALRSMPATDRSETFFRGWTRKEACLKAKGLGLNFPLSSLEVSLSPTPALLSVGNDRDEPSRWLIYDLRPELDFMAAIVVEATGLDPVQ